MKNISKYGEVIRLVFGQDFTSSNLIAQTKEVIIKIGYV